MCRDEHPTLAGWTTQLCGGSWSWVGEGEGVGFGITTLSWGEGKRGVKERSWGKRATNWEGRENSWLQMGQKWGKQRLFVSKYAPSCEVLCRTAPGHLGCGRDGGSFLDKRGHGPSPTALVFQLDHACSPDPDQTRPAPA